MWTMTWKTRRALAWHRLDGICSRACVPMLGSCALVMPGRCSASVRSSLGGNRLPASWLLQPPAHAVQVGNECSKYGNVQRVVIFEITEEDFPPELAVRIFVEFDRVESATKALVDLEGRFFGGRTVSCNFYSEQKLDRDEVAPFEGEDD